MRCGHYIEPLLPACLWFRCRCNISKIQQTGCWLPRAPVMEDKMHIFLFGDQTYQIGSELSRLASLCEDPILESFLSRAYQALRSEIAELPEYRRQQLPSLPSLTKLLAVPSHGPTHVAISQALTCTYHLASFIRYAKSSNQSGELSPKCC